jgi:uncharacterized metal-binding protein YceD (DUF177 family)
LKSLQQYHIPFSGLKIGKHQFDFDIDEAFFKEFEYSLVKKGNLKVTLELDKQETMLLLRFYIKGDIFQGCDLCLANFPIPLDLEEQEIVKFISDEHLEDNTDEIILLNRSENELNVAELIYEYIMLAVPLFSRCKEEGNTEWCDQEMLEQLRNYSAPAQENEESLDDPRWEALKNIKNKN